MFALAGSSGGARPKVMTEEWIIKFPASAEDPDSGIMEKAYMDCAGDEAASLKTLRRIFFRSAL